MLKYFYRDDCIVWMKVNSNLETRNSIYYFGFTCDNQEEAELLSKHLNNELDKWKKEMARNCTDWLECEEISSLKRGLQHWHVGKHCWM